MKGVGRGKGSSGGAGDGSFNNWIPDPGPVNPDDYDISQFYDMYGDNTSYSDWYTDIDPCTASPFEPFYIEEKISFALSQWAPPILICFGVVGNILSAVIMWILGRKKLSCCLYISLLSVTEMIILISRSGNDWIRTTFQVDITNWILLQSNAACQSYSCLTSFLYHMCGWLVVLPVAEMAVISKDYTTAHKICTRLRFKHTVLITVFVMVIINGHFFFTFALLGSEWDLLCRRQQCTFMPGGWGETFRDWLWPIIDNISALLGPILAIFVCLLFIILRPCFGNEKSQTNKICFNQYLIDTSALSKFRIICIALSLFFLCTATPEASYNTYEFILEKLGNNEYTDPTSFVKRELAATLGSFLRDLFLSCKVIIYFICWDQFRKKLCQIVRCRFIVKNVSKYRRYKQDHLIGKKNVKGNLEENSALTRAPVS